jgi:hypothetical protein
MTLGGNQRLENVTASTPPGFNTRTISANTSSGRKKILDRYHADDGIERSGFEWQARRSIEVVDDALGL